MRLIREKRIAFGKLIRQSREDKGFTKDRLLELLRNNGYEYSSVGAITNWERGMHIPKANVVATLAEILGVSREIFLNAAGYLR